VAGADKRELARRLRRNMTAAESVLWDSLRGRSCDGHNFRRQQVLMGYVVDFYCHRHRLAIEVDGEIHESQLSRDEERSKALSAAGFTIIRFKNHEVLDNLDRVLEKICATLSTVKDSPPALSSSGAAPEPRSEREADGLTPALSSSGAAQEPRSERGAERLTPGPLLKRRGPGAAFGKGG
jgi:very-short-patch-repair endonuclease